MDTPEGAPTAGPEAPSGGAPEGTADSADAAGSTRRGGGRRGARRMGGREANRDKRASGFRQEPAAPFRRRMPTLEALSADEVEAIHRASLEVLRDVGMAFLDERARALLREHGARVESGSETVRFDPEMVEEWVAKAPREFTLRSRDPETRIDIGSDRMVFSNVSSAPNCTDVEGGHRVGNYEDYLGLLRLTQHFNALEYVGGYPVEPQDLPPETRHLDCVRAMLTETSKPIYSYALGPNRILDGLEMLRRAAGLTDEDFQKDAWLVTVVNTSSPLRLDSNMIEGMFEMAAHNQPVIITPFTLSGAMAPASIAGALVQQNAEALASVALYQMMRPGGGTRCVYGGFTSNVDMKSGAPAFGTPEYFRAAAAGGQLTRRYGLPYRSSNVCAANAVDAQAAYESMFSLWGAVLGGAHVVKHGAGWMEGGLVASYEKMVLDVEMIQQFRRVMDPLATDAEGLALDAIREVGTGGHFFGTEHTISRYQTAFYEPMVSDWSNHGAWVEAGSPEAPERCRRIWKEALESFEAPPLDPSRREALDAYVDIRRREGGAETAPSLRSP